MTFPALNGTVGQGYKVGPTKISGINSLQRSCAINVFRTALNVQPPAAPPFTYMRACGSMNNVTFSTTLTKAGKTAVSHCSHVAQCVTNHLIISIFYFQDLSFSFTGLSIGFTLRILDGPINKTVVQSARVTDVEFIEYAGYHTLITGDAGIKSTLTPILEKLKLRKEAADALKYLMNKTILPEYDLKPL